MKKNKRTNNVLQNTTQKTKDVTVTFVAVMVDTTISNTFCQMCIHVLVKSALMTYIKKILILMKKKN
jgi:hypothetical protein